VDVVIDSSVLIAVERGALDLASLVDAEATEVCIAAITASEMLHGVHRLPGAVHRARVQAAVELLLFRVPVIPFDLDVARVHAMIAGDLRAKGTTIGPHDLMIAATAVHLDAAVPRATCGRSRRLRGWTSCAGNGGRRYQRCSSQYSSGSVPVTKDSL
jgi:tRNA(fMet)-specific endonuclease VapC